MALLTSPACYILHDGRIYIYSGEAMFTISATCRELEMERLGRASRPIFGLLWEIE
jgi:hypothetical protein